MHATQRGYCSSDPLSLLCLILQPVLMVKLLKPTAKQVLHWQTFWGQFRYEITCTAEEDNCGRILPWRQRRAATGADDEDSGLVGCCMIAACVGVVACICLNVEELHHKQ